MRNIRGRHALVGVLDSVAGGLVVAGLTQKLWWLVPIAVVVAGTGIVLDRFNLDDEEQEAINARNVK